MEDKTIDEEIRGLEIIIEDGSLKDCKVYHEAIVSYIKEQEKKHKKEINKILEECVGEEMTDYKGSLVGHSMLMSGYNQKRDKIIKIKETYNK